MPYREAFWLATSAVAPILAIALIVGSVASERIDDAARRTKLPGSDFSISVPLALGYVAYLSQAAVLLMSLLSLIAEQNVPYSWSPIAVSITETIVLGYIPTVVRAVGALDHLQDGGRGSDKDR